MPHPDHPTQLLTAIQALEAQRALLGDEAVNAAISALRAQLPAVEASGLESPAPFAGERKLVTVMFADISGFTALAERLDPEEVRVLMNACFNRLVPVIQKYEGTIDKFIGDEIMALFGAPRAHERHAELACRAALEMVEALRSFNRSKRTELKLHIGLNTGLVIAGGIGSEGLQQYSVMGDSVNLAARLKGAARPGEIFVGQETYLLTLQRFEFQALPPMRLKGKSEAAQVHSLHKERTDGELGWNGRLRSELIGREAELATLLTLIDELENGRGGRLAIIGEAGIGKSRLVAEARQFAGNIAWVEGRALSYTRQNSYQPAVEILRKLIAVPTEGSEEGLHIHLHRELEVFFPANPLQLYPYLASLLQLSLNEEEQHAIQYLNAERLRKRMHEAFGSYLKAIAAQRPLLLVWEDLHWSDPSSLLLLEQLMDLSREHPILFLLLFRPRTEDRIWAFHRSAKERYREAYHTLKLEALSPYDSSTLVCRLLRVERLAPEVEKMVFEKAEGNPFFVEELLRSLLDNGLLYFNKFETEAVGNLSSLSLPSTLQGVIASRIDQLPPLDKTVLQVASVLGRLFSHYLLQALLRRVDPALSPDPSLNTLLQCGLIRQRWQDVQEGKREYIFKHAVTHEVAYGSLLLSDRRHLHRLAGETIEAFSKESKDEIAEILARHFENAAEGDKTVYYLRLAANRAQQLFANEEAIDFCRRAVKQLQVLIDLEGSQGRWSTQMAELQEQLADILRLTGEYEEALTNYRLAQLHHREEDWIAKSRLERKMGLAYHAISHFDQVLNHFHHAEELLLQDDRSRSPTWWHEWLEVKTEQIILYYWRNQPDHMQAIAGRLQPELDAHGTLEQRTRFLSYLVNMHFQLERYLVSDATIMRAWELYEMSRQLTDRRLQSFNLFVVGFALLFHNDLKEAHRMLEEGLFITEQTGDVILQSRYLTYLTTVNRRLSHLNETEVLARQSLKIVQSLQMKEYIAMAYANLAWVFWKRGNWFQVESFGRQAYEIWHQSPHMFSVFVWTAAWPMAACYYRQANMGECLKQLMEMLHPERKRMEPELEAHLGLVVQMFENGSMDSLHLEVEKAFVLAEKYRYL